VGLDVLGRSLGEVLALLGALASLCHHLPQLPLHRAEHLAVLAGRVLALEEALDDRKPYFKRQPSELMWLNPAAELVDPNFGLHIRFVARICGMALLEGVCVALPVPDLFFQELLLRDDEEPDYFSELRAFDEQLYTQMGRIAYSAEELGVPGDFELYTAEELAALDRTMVFEDEEILVLAGHREATPLVPGGERIAVTGANAQDYLRLWSKQRLRPTGVERALRTFREGFMEVVPFDLSLSPSALRRLLCGRQALDVEDLIEHMVVLPIGDPVAARICQYFSTILRNWDERARQELLSFATGLCRLPWEGARALRPRFQVNVNRSLPTSNLHLTSSHEAPEHPYGRTLHSCFTGGCRCFKSTGSSRGTFHKWILDPVDKLPKVDDS